MSRVFTLAAMLIVCGASLLGEELEGALMASGILGSKQMAVRVSRDGLKAARFHLYSGSRPVDSQHYYMHHLCRIYDVTYCDACDSTC